MIKSDVEEFLKSWGEFALKVFRLQREFLPLDYVTFRRFNNGSSIFFETDIEKSTRNLGNFAWDDFSVMMSKNILVYEKDWGWGVDTMKMKTGGCNCGSWILKDNASLHGMKCPLYRSPM